MSKAISLARHGIYTTHPNPRVGCVIARDKQLLAEGWHEYTGAPHAEINALHGVEDKVSGATCYVSLEPCNHTGRTPPCTEALIKAGIERVVIAMSDPNPEVAGNGVKRLEQAGIKTELGLMQTEAEKLNPGYIKRMQSGKPYIRCKLAMSIECISSSYGTNRRTNINLSCPWHHFFNFTKWLSFRG